MAEVTRRSVLAGLAGLAATPVLNVCGSGGDQAGAGTTQSSATTPTTVKATTTTAPPVAPLTGLPFSGDPSALARPALVVKVSNADGRSSSHNARPQAGLLQADVVAELLTEGGVTRFASIFHSQDTDLVGPVRSFRTSELDLLPSLGLPLFAYSGANAHFLAILRNSGRVVDVGVDHAQAAYHRVGDRARDQSLMASTLALREASGGKGTTPGPWFTYRGANETAPGAGARPIGGVGFSLGGGGAPVQYTWNGAGFARVQRGTPHVDVSGVQIAPPNVLLQFVNYRNSGERDTAGSPVPEAVLVGSGTAWTLSNGHVVEGSWTKRDDATATVFLDAAGQPVRLTPGTTWMALIPAGTASLVA